MAESQDKPITEETARRLADVLSRVPINTAQKSIEIAKKPFVQIRQSQFLAGIFGTLGFVMFAFGMEGLLSSIPILSSPIIKIVLGLLIMTASGLAIKKLA